MGRVGEVLGFERRNEAGVKWADVKVDLGGGNVVTAIYFPPLGEDAWPFAGEFAFLSEAGSGYVALGFQDPQLDAPAAEPGERVVFSRSALGTIAAKAVYKTDGSIVLNDTVTISPSGDISADGSASIGGDVAADGEVSAMNAAAPINLSTHVHPTGTGPSGPPTP